MSGDVGSQYTPAAGWAQAIVYHRDVLGDAELGRRDRASCSAARRRWRRTASGRRSRWRRRSSCRCCSTSRTTASASRCKSDMQTPGANIAREPRVVREPVRARRRRHAIPARGGAAARRVRRPRARRRRARRSCGSPCRGSRSHSGPDNQKGYRTDEEIAADVARDPLPKLRSVPRAGVHVGRGLDGARGDGRARRGGGARGGARAPGARSGDACAASSTPRSRARATPWRSAGCTAAERDALGGTEDAGDRGRRHPLRRGGAAHARARARGESEGCWCSARTWAAKGGVHLVTEGLQKRFGADARVRHEPLRGGDHRPRGRDGARRAGAGGRDPVPEVRRSGARSSSTTAARCAGARPTASPRRSWCACPAASARTSAIRGTR